MHQAPRRRARFIAPHLLGLVLASMLVSGQAAASPILSVSPDSLGPIELPYGRPITLGGLLQIRNLDTQGPAPLTWAIRDVLHGTETDVPWILESPGSGTIVPGGSAAVRVSIGADPTAGGPHVLDLVIESNDPVHSRVVVPFRLTIVAPVPARQPTFGALKARYR